MTTKCNIKNFTKAEKKHRNIDKVTYYNCNKKNYFTKNYIKSKTKNQLQSQQILYQ